MSIKAKYDVLSLLIPSVVSLFLAANFCHIEDLRN
jgi:hypothetical protein